MSSSDTHRLTSGNILWELIRFALPFLGSHILMSLYGAADVLIVSHFADSSALAATAIGAQAVFTVMALALGLSLGSTILIGQYFGAKKDDDVRETIGTSLSISFIVGLLASLLIFAFSGQITAWLETPTEAFQGTKHYIQICGGLIVLTFLYEAISAVLRGLGDSKNPLKFVAVACIINVLLDLLFVGYFRLGAAGAALATVMAQGCSVLFAIFYLKGRKFIFDFRLKSFKFIWQKAKLILTLGIPSSFQQAIVFISYTIMTIEVNKFGVIEAATLGITNRLDGFLIMPSLAFGAAISVMAAQNIGALKPERAKKALYTGFLLSLIFAIPSFFLMYFWPDKLMALVSSDAVIIQAGDLFMQAYSTECIFMALIFCIHGFINGCGHTSFTMFNNVFVSLAFRVPLILWATNLYEVGLSMPFSTMPQIVIALIYLASGRWKKSVIGEKKYD